MDALEKLIIARTALISSSPFFGSLATLFKFKEMKDLPFVAGTDGEYFYYNPSRIVKLSNRQLHFIFAHEVMHCALGHIWRTEKRDKMRWNFATDFVINLILEKNNFELIDGCLLDHKFNNMSSEQVYDILPQQKTLSIKSKSSNGMSNTEQIPNGESDKDPTKNHEKWGKGKGKKKDSKNGKDGDKKKWEDVVSKFGKKKNSKQRMWE
jgi:predicted metal-dependent peptidase